MNRTDISPDESRIRAKAFELWQARGCPEGSPEADWFSAKHTIETFNSARDCEAPGSTGPEALPLGLCIATELAEASPPIATTAFAAAPPSATRTKRSEQPTRPSASSVSQRAPRKTARKQKSR